MIGLVEQVEQGASRASGRGGGGGEAKTAFSTTDSAINHRWAGGTGASTFSVSHAASSHFLGGNAASLSRSVLDTCKVEGGRTQRQNLCRHSEAYKNHVGLLSDCNRMNAESERENSRGKKKKSMRMYETNEEDEGGEDAEEEEEDV